MMIPTTASGAPKSATMASIVGDSAFASPTTATRHTSRSALLAAARPAEGGAACASSPAASSARK
jgi:hypothetical protein